MDTTSPPCTDKDEVAYIVRAMGGPTEVARFFGISQPAVSQWLVAGCLPRARRRHLMDVRPDLFSACHAADGGGTQRSSSEVVQRRAA